MQYHLLFLQNNSGHSLKDVKDGDAMVLAINFYTGITWGEQVIRGGGLAIRHANGFAFNAEEAQDRQRFGKEVDEIIWWMNKGFSYLPPYIGKCTRMDNFDKSLIDVFEPGVVFQWSKHTSSNRGDRIS